MGKRLLTTAITDFMADYFCTLCSYIPKAGDIMYIIAEKARCPRCGTCFSVYGTNRFKSCSVPFEDIPNQNYPEDFRPTPHLHNVGNITCTNCNKEYDGVDECPNCSKSCEECEEDKND